MYMCVCVHPFLQLLTNLMPIYKYQTYKITKYRQTWNFKSSKEIRVRTITHTLLFAKTHFTDLQDCNSLTRWKHNFKTASKKQNFKTIYRKVDINKETHRTQTEIDLNQERKTYKIIRLDTVGQSGAKCMRLQRQYNVNR